MTKVDFYFDPVCPFAWIGGQWIREVASQRPRVELRFRVMSLAVLNEARSDQPSEESKGLDSAWRPVRVATALADRCGEAVLAEFFEAFGSRFHVQGLRGRDRVIREVLAELDASDLLAAADDPAWDQAVRFSHQQALDPVGEGGIGTPVMHVDGRGVFGPVLASIPRGEEAERVFDAVVTLTSRPLFLELKRSFGGGSLGVS